MAMREIFPLHTKLYKHHEMIRPRLAYTLYPQRRSLCNACREFLSRAIATLVVSDVGKDATCRLRNHNISYSILNESMDT